MKKTIAFVGVIALILVSFIVYLVFNKPEEKEESFEEISVNDVLVEEVFKSVDAGSNYDFQDEVYKKGTFSNKILNLSTNICNILSK